MEKPKYIAEGFEEDATRLLNEFEAVSSTEFSEFAKIWKKNYFSLVFMGRPDRIETSEFTNEVFRISMHFLSSPSFYRSVGAVYLLYALFRNQISDPPIKIRIEIEQWRIIKNMQQEALLQAYRTMHFVIDYLIENAFIYVAHQTLKGPLTGALQKISKGHEIVSSLKLVYKSDLLEYSVQNNLQKLRDLHTPYLEIKKNLGSEVFKSSYKVSLCADDEIYDGFVGDLNKLLNTQKGRTEGAESVGTRRARIKAESFFRKTKDRFGRRSFGEHESETEEADDPDFHRDTQKKKKCTKNKRVPKHERKVGRPSKKPKVEIQVEEKSDDDNIDISHLINQQTDFYLPPEEDCKKLKCKPGRYYYKLSPKREEEDDDSSDPGI